MRAKLSLACLALFCVAMLAGAWLYPGGSWRHPHAVGFSIVENFWCDLLREPAHNGAANARSVWLGTVAFAALGISLAPFWLEVSRLLPEARAKWVRACGLVSAAATALVALVPSDRYPQVHAPAVLLAGGLGLFCGVLLGRFALEQRRREPWLAATSLFLLCAASVNLALYVWVAYFHGPETVVLPAVQKLATMGLVTWMTAGLAASARRPKP
jgi:hypothetical protein